MPKLPRPLVLILFTLATTCLFSIGSGCSSSPEAAEGDEPLGKHRAGISTTSLCHPGATCTFTIRLPGGFTPSHFTLAAGDELLVNDRARTRYADTAWAPVANAGTGTTNIGSFADVGDIWSNGRVWLRSGSRVWGDVHTSGPVDTQEGDDVQQTDRVKGSILSHRDLSPYREVSWSVDLPAVEAFASLQPVVNQQTATLTPGAYQILNVHSGSKAVLTPGVYFFDWFTFESGAILELKNAAGPIQIYVRRGFIWRGNAIEEAPDKGNVLFAYTGPETNVSEPPTVVIEAFFRGTIVAPNAEVSIGTVGHDPGHVGQIFAKRIEVHQATTIWHRPYTRDDCAEVDASGCGLVFGCAPKDTDGDGLTDCDEDADGDFWTDKNVFNGAKAAWSPRCTGAPTCAAIDTAAEVDACTLGTPVEEQAISSGWDWGGSAMPSEICNAGYRFRPNWTQCSSDWQVDYKSKLKLDNGGQHCFQIAGDAASTCGSLFVEGASTAITFETGAQCFDLEAGIYDLRWFYMTGSPKKALRVRYCFGGDEACAPTESISNRMLRPEFEGEPECEEGGNCTELCPCSGGGICDPAQGNAECAGDLVCPQEPNPDWFNGAPGEHRCIHPQCDELANELGCGYEGAPCGPNCCDRRACTSDADCTGGQVCGQGNGRFFGCRSERVCEDPICTTDPQTGGCGAEGAPCGDTCRCIPQCEGKVCGGDLNDGCDGTCPAVCQNGEVCQAHSECQPGSLCVQGGGDSVGLPGQNVCLPATNAGAALPSCSARECGTDPRTGANCGACSGGHACNAGLCVKPLADTPVLIPDGQGGQRPLDPLEPAIDTTIGALHGSFSVSDRGTPSYKIPILVPPGRLGMQPELSLSYGGTLANGHLGVGWQLEGLSTITRCGRTVAMDGQVRPILGDDGDGFCIDGKRLIPVAGSQNGADGAEYRTAVDTFAKVISHGAGPNSFEVRFKDGRIATYGSTVDATLSDREGVPHSWYVRRIEDRRGNNIHVVYAKSETHSVPDDQEIGHRDGDEIVPAYIMYTGRGQHSGNRFVRFEYEDRPDKLFGYRHRDSFKMTQRLKIIRTSVGAQRGRSYRIEYEQAANGKSRIHSVAECATDTSCKNPTTFTYEEKELGFVDQGDFLNARQGVWLDVNGDGFNDLLETKVKVDGHETERMIADAVVTGAGSFAGPYGFVAGFAYGFISNEIWPVDIEITNTMYLAQGDRGRAFFDGRNVSGLSCQRTGAGLIMDFNWDGRDDIVETCLDIGPITDPSPTYSLMLRGGDPSGNFINYGNVLTLPPWAAPIAYDINGDGLQDVMYCTRDGGSQYRLRDPETSISPPGSAFYLPARPIAGGCPIVKGASRLLLDVDNDGALNLVIASHAGWAALMLDVNGEPYWDREGSIVVFPKIPYFEIPRYAAPRVGDFNGDGFSDILFLPRCGDDFEELCGQFSPVLWLNKGGRFSQVNLLDALQYRFDLKQATVLDYDLDGTSDILQLNANPSLRRLNQGSLFIDSVPLTGVQKKWDLVGDADGDGVADLFVPRMQGVFQPEPWLPEIEVQVGLDIHYGKGAQQGFLKKVQDGLGNFIEVEYGDEVGSPNPPTYTPGVFCPYPQVCIKRLPNLVREHREGFEVGEQRTTTRTFEYRYWDGRMDVAGHGWLGFAEREVTEVDSANCAAGVCGTTHIEYEPFATVDLPNGGYVYPKAGLIKSYTVTGPPTSSALASSDSIVRTTAVDNTWLVNTSTGGMPFPYLRSKRTRVQDNEQTLVNILEEFEVDDYGNVTRHRVPGDELRVEETAYELTPARVDAWQISLPETVSVFSRRSGDEKTRTTRFTHYPTGELETVIREPGSSYYELKTVFHRDADGNVEQIDTEETSTEAVRTLLTAYDADGVFPLTYTNVKGHQVQVRFDPRTGQMSAMADPNGIAEQWVHDAYGHLSHASGLDGRITVERAAASPVQSVHGWELPVVMSIRIQNDTTGDFVAALLDPLGRTVQSSFPGFEAGTAVFEETEYTARGLVRHQSRPHLAADNTQGFNRFFYDSWNRITRVVGADFSERTFEYVADRHLKFEHWPWRVDGAVEYVRITDVIRTASGETEPNKQNVMVYDHYGLPIRNVDGNNLVNTARSSRYHYGAFNELRVITDNEGHQTLFTPDLYGRIASIADPDTGTETFTHNAFDDIKTRRDANQRLTEFFYDSLGRVERVVDGEGETRFTYDGTQPNELGRLVSMVAPDPLAGTEHETRYAYYPPTGTENHGRLMSVTQVLDKGGDHEQQLTTGFEYNGPRLSVVRYPESPGRQFAIRYSYSGPYLSSVTEVGSSNEKQLWKLLRSDQGYRIGEEQLGPHALSTRAYEPRTGRVSLIQTEAAGNILQHLSYTYWDNGNVKTRQDHQLDEAPRVFNYDPLNRLAQVTQQIGGASSTQSYGYDHLGNLTSKPGVGAYTYPGRPHLAQTAGANAYQYDAAGNQHFRQGPAIQGGQQAIDYTAFDLPRTVTTGTGPEARLVSFGYDATQTRAVKRTPDATTYYAGNLYRRTITTDATPAATTHRYRVYAAGTQIAEVERSDDPSVPDKTWYLHNDAQGSLNAISTEDGQVHPVDYAAFGETTLGAQAQTGIVTGFTGHEHDEDLGLIDMGGRMYDPTLGRFLTADPVMQAPFWTQGLNRYSYVFNNPVNNIDPDGFQAVPIYAGYAPPVTSQPPPLPVETITISGTGSMASATAASSTTATAASQAAAAGQAAGQAAHQAAANAGASGAASASSGGPSGAAAAGTAAGTMLGRMLSQLTGGGNKVGGASAPTGTSGDAPLPRSQHDATAQNVPADNVLGCGECWVNRRNLTPEQRAAMNTGTEWSATLITSAGSLVNLGKAAWRLAKAGLEAAKRAAGREAAKAAAKEAAKAACFPGGTLVHTEQGLRPIEEVQEGDLVWSRDETTDAQALRRVLRTFVTPDQPMLELRLEGAAQSEILKVTSEHPFWKRERGWVAAGELHSGDHILQRSGGWLRVAGATWAQERATVYNFEVEGYHSYFVGTQAAWVHNSCSGAAREAGAQGARQASTAFGRSVESLKQQLGGAEGPWTRLTAHAEGATSQSKRLKDAVSIEEVFVHRETGERVIRHTIVRAGEVLHETFRPFAKFGAP